MWSYDPSGGTVTDQVRLLIGDTDSTDQQLQNEELATLIAAAGSTTSAAAMACRTLAARYARFADKWVGDLKILASQKSRAYERLAEQYEDRGAVYAVPSAGGIRLADKEANTANTELVQPAFRIGVHDS